MSGERSNALAIHADAVDLHFGTRDRCLVRGHDQIALAIRIGRDAADDLRQILVRLEQEYGFRMVVPFEGSLGIVYPAHGGIGTGCRAYPRHREVVESPALDGDFVVFGLEYCETEFVDRESVTKGGDHAQPAGTGLDRSRLLCARLGFGSGASWGRFWRAQARPERKSQGASGPLRQFPTTTRARQKRRQNETAWSPNEFSGVQEVTRRCWRKRQGASS
jgi:hypothetical protein